MTGGKRDKDETMKKLVTAVGDILREEGYTGLGVNKVAARAGVSKILIYRYFDSMNNLLKRYVQEKDYWLPLFDQLKESELPREHELPVFYTSVLQEQFRFFFQEREMQALILWQLSQRHPLMRHISDIREAEGGKLLALADHRFRHGVVSFKAVTAILVEGIYGLTLHAHANKSTVCGIDINNDRDRDIIMETISQIINWAFEAADKLVI